MEQPEGGQDLLQDSTPACWRAGETEPGHGGAWGLQRTGPVWPGRAGSEGRWPAGELAACESVTQAWPTGVGEAGRRAVLRGGSGGSGIPEQGFRE